MSSPVIGLAELRVSASAITLYESAEQVRDRLGADGIGPAATPGDSWIRSERVPKPIDCAFPYGPSDRVVRIKGTVRVEASILGRRILVVSAVLECHQAQNEIEPPWLAVMQHRGAAFARWKNFPRDVSTFSDAFLEGRPLVGDPAMLDLTSLVDHSAHTVNRRLKSPGTDQGAWNAFAIPAPPVPWYRARLAIVWPSNAHHDPEVRFLLGCRRQQEGFTARVSLDAAAPRDLDRIVETAQLILAHQWIVAAAEDSLVRQLSHLATVTNRSVDSDSAQVSLRVLEAERFHFVDRLQAVWAFRPSSEAPQRGLVAAAEASLDLVGRWEAVQRRHEAIGEYIRVLTSHPESVSKLAVSVGRKIAQEE
jgi:hypothetical protein